MCSELSYENERFKIHNILNEAKYSLVVDYKEVRPSVTGHVI